ncbi:6154_t:CDS:2 [Funneliformis mosseae]|uniref:6154_t:CDS:1 n=1 Tax=Funneliformis mosseae TaxID=27381 RepID=A0A9N9CUD5_FUNMO|nr:6154_t:CDS:2 [Funneliformis mosseae]
MVSDSSDEEVITKRQPIKIKPRTFLPKPRRVVTNGSPTNTSASVTQSPSETVEPLEIRPNAYNDDDDDIFFTRNTTFSRKMTSKKSRRSEILRTLEDNPKLHTNEAEKEEGTKRKAKSKGKGKLSDWTTSDEPITMFDEESDHIYISDAEERKKIRINPDENIRFDSQEDSLTPPPEISHYLLQSTLAPLHAALSQFSRTIRSDGNDIGSPIAASVLQDDIELDPELLAIQQSIKQKKRNSIQSVDTKVEILVKPKHHLCSSISGEDGVIPDYEKPIKFILNTEDTFEQLISHLCSRRGIPKPDLVLTYKNVKVFPRGTPSSLGMSGLVHLEAFNKESYMHFKEQQKFERKRLFDGLYNELMDNDNNTSVNSSRETIDIETIDEIRTIINEEENYIYLKVQCQDETVEKLKSLTVQAVIERYKKIKDISGNVAIKLLFEDEVLLPDDKLIDTDLEDGDMLSVKII